MEEIAKLYATIGGDNTKLKTSLTQSKSMLKTAETDTKQSTSIMSGAFAKLGTAIAGAFAVEKVISFVRQSVEAASDLNETMNKVDVVFGKSSKAVQDFGSNSARALGMSKNEALAAAGTYGNLFRAMNIGEEESARMSTSLVKLAADLASFNNIDPAIVLDKLRAGLSGEVEPLRTLGINLNIATIQEKALELGLIKTKGELDAAAKAQASYAIIMEQTALAQGDFSRTSDGLANQTRILSGEIEDLKASIGEGLLPTVKKAVPVLGDVITSARKMNETYTPLQRVLASFPPLTTLIIAGEIEAAKTEREHAAALAKLADNSIMAVRSFDKQQEALKNLIPVQTSFKTGVKESYWAMLDAASAAGTYANGILNLDEQTRRVSEAMGEYTNMMMFNKLAASLNEEQQLQLAASLGLINQEAAYASPRMDEIARKFKAGEISAYDAMIQIAALRQEMDALKDKTITVTINTVYPNGVPIPGGTGVEGGVTPSTSKGPKNVGLPPQGPGGYAYGGSFMIPSGYSNDSYPLGMGRWASSGETVTVTPKGKTTGNVTVNVNGSGDPVTVAYKVAREIRRRI